MRSVILRAATRLLGGIVLVFAIYLLWRGHHAPGGGFIAALVAATGFVLVALTGGPESVRQGLLIPPRYLIASGLLLALAAGFAAVIKGQPFLTGQWYPAQKALIGTPLIFDIGVFLVVLGAILNILLALEES
jgi:multisubunit Na+/H+ antiporter MnhB subunit